MALSLSRYADTARLRKWSLSRRPGLRTPKVYTEGVVLGLAMVTQVEQAGVLGYGLQVAFSRSQACLRANLVLAPKDAYCDSQVLVIWE